MRTTAILLIQALRVLIAALALWQIFGFLPVFTWLSAPSEVTPGMWIVLLFKVIWLAVLALLIFGLKRLVSRIKAKQQRPKGREVLGRCPTCKATIPVSSRECPSCASSLGRGVAVKVEAL